MRPLFLLTTLCWILWLPAAVIANSVFISAVGVIMWFVEGYLIRALWQATRRLELEYLGTQL